MSLSVETYALSKKYTNDSISGISGALAGKNCTIQSITEITGGHRVTFQWTADDSTVRTSTMDVMDGSGAEAIEQIYADNGILGAKNLLKNECVTATKNGVTATVNSDGTVTVDGTATAEAIFTIHRYLIDIKLSGNFILNGCPAGGANETYQIYLQRRNAENTGWANPIYRDFGNGVNATVEDGRLFDVNILIRNGATLNNLTFKPMLRLASDPDDTYVPYAMTNKELTEDKYYHAGEAVNVSLTNFAGLITNSGKEIRFTIPLMKDLSKITGITFKNTTTIGIRKPEGGYIVDGTISSGYTITILSKAGNLLSLKLTKTDDSAFDATNNTPLDVAFTGGSNDSVITFS